MLRTVLLRTRGLLGSRLILLPRYSSTSRSLDRWIDQHPTTHPLPRQQLSLTHYQHPSRILLSCLLSPVSQWLRATALK